MFNSEQRRVWQILGSVIHGARSGVEMQFRYNRRWFETRHRIIENPGEIAETLERRRPNRMERLTHRDAGQGDGDHVSVDVAFGFDDCFDSEREDVGGIHANADAIRQFSQHVGTGSEEQFEEVASGCG